MSLAQLSQLLPLPEEELRQVLEYAATLSKAEAASHFSNLLGESPLAVEFITSFNARRAAPVPTSQPPGVGDVGRASPLLDAVPKGKRPPRKKTPAIHTPEARRVDQYPGPATTAYTKKNSDLAYIPGGPSSVPASRAATPPVQATSQQPPKQHASSAGHLISEVLPKPKAKSNPSSRSSTPNPAGAGSATISIAGGTPMAGQSTALADLDAAIRALEITTNPSLESGKRRRCNCVATRHPLQSAAPNCLSCGKVICVMEGLGPCTFCSTPLLNSDEVQSMLRELKDERGREKMAANAAVHRRAEVSKKPAPFAQLRGGGAGDDDGSSLADAAAKAREHRDKLLGFQAQNARRTTVRDEAADFDVSGATTGTGSMWASPEERARELKRQQKLMREMEWNARPEHEKRRQVLSIDVVGGKVVRKMAAVARPATPEPDEDEAGNEAAGLTAGRTHGGAFSGNPLLGALLRPVFEPRGQGNGGAGLEGRRKDGRKSWRRVQDDLDDNEGVILDGGVYGHGDGGGAGDEPARA